MNLCDYQKFGWKQNLQTFKKLDKSSESTPSYKNLSNKIDFFIDALSVKLKTYISLLIAIWPERK